MSVASELLNSRHVSDVDWHCIGMHVRLTTTCTSADSEFDLGLPAVLHPVRRIEDNVSHVRSLLTTRLSEHEHSTARLIILVSALTYPVLQIWAPCILSCQTPVNTDFLRSRLEY